MPPGALLVKCASFRVRHRDVVTAGHDAEHAGPDTSWDPRPHRTRHGRPWTRAKRRQSAVRVGAELDVHVVVARETRRREFSVRVSIHLTGRPSFSAPTIAQT